jgi:hypothetical protein
LAHAQQAPKDEPVGFEIAYGMSFFDFDACGDRVAGALFRQLIRDKVKSCPYSQAAKEKFAATVARDAEAFLSVLLTGISAGRPDQFKSTAAEQGISCKEYQQTPAYVERRKRLVRYQYEEIGIDDALGDSDCPSGPASL